MKKSMLLRCPSCEGQIKVRLKSGERVAKVCSFCEDKLLVYFERPYLSILERIALDISPYRLYPKVYRAKNKGVF